MTNLYKCAICGESFDGATTHICSRPSLQDENAALRDRLRDWENGRDRERLAMKVLERVEDDATLWEIIKSVDEPIGPSEVAAIKKALLEPSERAP